MLRVPYVPTLGSVHPDTLCPELFDDVLAASWTGQVLPFDKDRRWSQRKDHILLAEEIIHRHGHGRALWRAATAWAEQHRAVYQLLQAETGQVSERLFLSEGLASLGFTCALAA